MFDDFFATFKFLADIAAWIASGGVVAAIAIGVGIYVKEYRVIAIAVAVAAISSTFFFAKGTHTGIGLTDAKWKAREQATVVRAVDARKSAEAEVKASTAGRPAGAHADKLRNDRHDRDQR